MRVDLQNIRQRSQSVKEYVYSLEDKWKDIQLEEFQDYKLDETVVEELKGYADGITIVSIGANWCKDCRKAIPVLMKLEEELGLEVRVFGSVKTAPLDPNRQWAVPPSPPEVDDWGVTAIPWIEIFDEEGVRIGTIVEKPVHKSTLEAEILHVLKQGFPEG
jgi:thiol-disulfide isomerase/thioredoxin